MDQKATQEDQQDYSLSDHLAEVAYWEVGLLEAAEVDDWEGQKEAGQDHLG